MIFIIYICEDFEHLYKMLMFKTVSSLINIAISLMRYL